MVNITDDHLQMIMYISVYVEYKLQTVIKCPVFCAHLLTKQNLLIDRDCSYIKFLDRGGLKYPSEFAVQVGIVAFQIFLTLISEKNETKLLSCQHQKTILFAFIIEAIECDIENFTFTCGNDILLIGKRCAVTWCNILLNNYTKNKTNEINDIKNNVKQNKKLMVLNLKSYNKENVKPKK